MRSAALGRLEAWLSPSLAVQSWADSVDRSPVRVQQWKGPLGLPLHRRAALAFAAGGLVLGIGAWRRRKRMRIRAS